MTESPGHSNGRRQLTGFLQRWVITTLGVMVAAVIIPGVDYTSFNGLLQASLLLGVLSALTAPIKILLGCLSFGLLAVLINATLLALVSTLIKDFTVTTFWSAVGGSIVISCVSVAATLFVGGTANRNVHFEVRTGRPPHPPRDRHRIDDDDDPKGGGSGPVIDV